MKKDFYYALIEASWTKLSLIVLFVYFISNAVFALMYYSIPFALNGTISEQATFYESFFFSVQTMSTIGYGALSPNGILANILVTFEAAFGLIIAALLTGIVFAKLSKPHAKIRYSKKAIISQFDGVTCLSFRIGNTRGNDIVEAKINVSILLDETTSEGKKFRKIHNLDLRRSYTPFFKLSWTNFHPIDENSPIYNFEKIKDNLRSIVVTITGHDGSYSNTIYSRYTYTIDDLEKDKYFEDIMIDNNDGDFTIDYSKFDNLIS